MNLEEGREYYDHSGDCTRTNFTPLNERGFHTCLDCAGIFDADGKGLALLDRRLDEDYEVKKAELDAEEAIHKARRG